MNCEIDNRIRVRAELSPMFINRSINLFCFTSMGERQKPAVAKLLFETLDNRCEPIEPFARLEKDEAQILMDDLWNAGIRPTEGEGSAGAMAAVQKHLGDMRKIVFDRLKIKA